MAQDPPADVLEQLAQAAIPGAQLQGAARLTGGVSAQVYRLDLLNGATAVRLVLRIHGDTHGGHSAPLEFALLNALADSGLPVPRARHVDDSGALWPDPLLLIDWLPGSSVPPGRSLRFARMAQMLRRIHDTPIDALPALPARTAPFPEGLDYLPRGPRWATLRSALTDFSGDRYTGPAVLLHGDFWPENLLWTRGHLTAVLDWEDAAFGDPLCDLAAAQVELRYLFGRGAMGAFLNAYARNQPIDPLRLALWQIYVAAAAHCYMGQWGLPRAREAHMRREALATIEEAGAVVLGA
ncbi:MAG: phosphotransferase [Pseudomonadota bacterium]